MKLIAFIILFIYIQSSFAQNALSTNVFVLTGNVIENPNVDIYQRKLSDDGKFTLEPGIVLSYEQHANLQSGMKVTQAVYWDRANQLAGFTQVGIKIRVKKSFKKVLSLTIGPAMHYRQSWAGIENYQPNDKYQVMSQWQYQMTWLSGELEFSYIMNKMYDFSVSIQRVHPEALGVCIGAKYWISRKPSKKNGCISCPTFH